MPRLIPLLLKISLPLIVIDQITKWWVVFNFKQPYLPFQEYPYLPPLGEFLPEWIRENREKFDGKKILTYCTGGIRCEKFSGFLVKEGFENVSQLHGGIVKYGKDPEVKGEDFDGQCYVFDERIGVPINSVNPEVVAFCVSCGQPSERYVNCKNQMCNAQHFCCEGCEAKSKRCCSDACREIYTVKYEGVVK